MTPSLELRHLLYAEHHISEVHSFPDDTAEELNALGMFNEKQGFQYMRKPISMIRPSTGLVARQLMSDDVADLGTKDRRVVVTGKAGTGKSFILLQMAAMALMKNYVVIAVPRGNSASIPGLITGMDLVDNRTAYSLDERTLRYKQTDYVSNMLSRTKNACSWVLEDVLSFP